MDYNELQTILLGIQVTADLSTIIVNIPKFNLKVSAKAISDIQSHQNLVDDVLTTCFLRKEVLWQRLDYENFDWSYNSIVDLQKKLDKYTESLVSESDEKQYFLSQLLRIWGTYCNEAYKELFRADGEVLKLNKSLNYLRKKTFPIIITLLYILPEDNLLKKEGLEKLEKGCKHSKIKLEQIIPEWKIE